MQDQLNAQYPGLGIQVIGINEVGQESANNVITSGRDLPWLQDVDANSNGDSDIWDEQWQIEYRDVVIVDANQIRRGAFNLTFNDLGETANFDLLKDTAVAIAENNPIWQNDSNHMDVNNDAAVSPVGDVLSIINELNNPVYSDGSGNLPVPAVVGSYPYLDVNGDYVISPVGDVLSLINFLNGNSGGEGEGGDSSLTISWLGDQPANTPESSDALGTVLPGLIATDQSDLIPTGVADDESTSLYEEATDPDAFEDLASDVAALWSL